MEFIDKCEERTMSGYYIDVCAPLWVKLSTANQDKIKTLINTELRLGHLRKSPLPISGKELMSLLKLEKGEIVGKVLNYLKRNYRNQIWKTKPEGLELAKKYLDKNDT